MLFMAAGVFTAPAISFGGSILALPLGLCVLLLGHGQHPLAESAIFILAIGLPPGLTLWCLLEDSRGKFFKLYSILCAIFVLTIAACWVSRWLW